MRRDEDGNFFVEEEELENFNDALKSYQEENAPTENNVIDFYEKGDVNSSEVKTSPQKIEMTLYDMNKQLISQKPVMTRFDLNNHRITFAKWIYDNPANYYMLLCHELNYYTIFHRNGESVDQFIDWVYLIMEELGDMKDISIDSNGAVALWANWNKNPNQLGCFYLFPYDKGMIETSEEPV